MSESAQESQMPNDDADPRLVDEAEKWLRQILDDLRLEYLRDSLGPSPRISWELEKYTPELQNAIDSVLSKWVMSDDEDQVGLAFGLILGMKRKRCIPTLERLSQEIDSGQRKLPEYARVGGMQEILRVMALPD